MTSSIGFRTPAVIKASEEAIATFNAKKGSDGKNLVVRGAKESTHLKYTNLTICELFLQRIGKGPASANAISLELTVEGKWEKALIEAINQKNSNCLGMGKATADITVQAARTTIINQTHAPDSQTESPSPAPILPSSIKIPTTLNEDAARIRQKLDETNSRKVTIPQNSLPIRTKTLSILSLPTDALNLISQRLVQSKAALPLLFVSKAFKNLDSVKNDNTTEKEAICSAVESGSISLVSWYAERLKYKLPDDACRISAKSGNLSLLQWLKKNNCSSVDTCELAALHGHFDVVKWACETGKNDYFWAENMTLACCNAALNGHFEILKWLKAYGCPWNELTCSYAAGNGHFEILKWAHENGCPWDNNTCYGAAKNGHFDIVKWAHENGCP